MLLDTDKIRAGLRMASGTDSIVDMGVVDRSRMGYSDCAVSTGIERWEDMYFVWISVVHQKNSAGRNTRVVKWPYSRRSAADLDGVLADLRALEATATGATLPDKRGWFERLLDKLTRSEYVGEYHPASQLDAAPVYTGRVVAKVARWGGQLNVSMTESKPGGTLILAQFPVAAFARIRQALAGFAAAHQESA